MKKLKTAMLVSGAVVTVGGAGFGTAATYATSGGNHDRGGWSSGWKHGDSPRDVKYDAALSEALTKKFNLDKTEVESVIKQVRADQKDDVKDQKYDKLSTALSENTISQEQYDKVYALYKDTDTLISSLNDANDDEKDKIKDQIKDRYSELKQYLKDQNLSWKDLGFEKGRGDHNHH